ncbi:uncharacterized protein N7479_004371 [Penicillium vulpinum]|uniref:Uncharacterized protein n=1 Tax=Penicillium vulpinum TaxID=29845 RepID=A0A1V6SCL3_9EURO|nr:uncharacterized protein N7479_004371 [Penicillium vulpinum]KAJ5964495.1 hypothetical protein N7479_004371 [Penicillium vulpinum]OQE11765.1 hypothetical protein PENVUL_c002G09893 [Penicillium vulpinum]
MSILYARPGPNPHTWNREGPQCANCHYYVWKQPQVPIFQSPARSQWAKPHSNPYICDNCYWDLNGSVDGIPCMRSLPCLCARRDNLAILLVSKRVWNDAAPIFWMENWFAFEHPCLLTGFLTAIRPQVRSWLRRISFMPIHAYNNNEHSSIFPQWRDPIWNGWNDIRSCWSLLRLCEGLTELELDVLSLTRKEWAHAIRLIRVKKRVVFFRQLDPYNIEYEPGDPINTVWGSHARRKRFDSPTTALLASSMTGDRAIKRKALITHYSENTLHQRCGDYGVQFIEKMIEGRKWNS